MSEASPGAFPDAAAPPSAAFAIEVKKLDKVFPSRVKPVVALSDINLTVGETEFVSIVGPSGCGKSTLLKILAGLVPYTSGTARIAGTELQGPRSDIGVVFQSPVLFPWRNILENVMLPVEVLGLHRAQYTQRAHQLLAMAGLEQFSKHYPNELSGGMQQRVGLVRALIHDPAILLMDEPFGALDALTRETMNLELQRIWMARKRAVLFITHSIGEAIFLGSKVVVMTPRPGQIAVEMDIDIPRPRTLEVMNTPKFGEFASIIRNHLNARGGIE